MAAKIQCGYQRSGNGSNLMKKMIEIMKMATKQYICRHRWLKAGQLSWQLAAKESNQSLFLKMKMEGS